MSLLVNSSAHADSVTFGPTLFDNGGPNYTAGSSGSFSLPQFNPALGTLTGVNLAITGNSFGGSNYYENLGDNSGSATVTIGSNITVTGPASLVVITLPSESNTGPIGPYDGSLDPSDSVTVTGTSSSDSASNALTNPPTNLSAYIGLGSAPFNFSSTVNNSSSSTASPGVSGNTPPDFNFDATITYTYSEVPEPASIGLIAVALPLLAARRRRKA
jgi:hypothetical protein